DDIVAPMASTCATPSVPKRATTKSVIRQAAHLKEKIQSMFNGKHVSEDLYFNLKYLFMWLMAMQRMGIVDNYQRIHRFSVATVVCTELSPHRKAHTTVVKQLETRSNAFEPTYLYTMEKVLINCRNNKKLLSHVRAFDRHSNMVERCGPRKYLMLSSCKTSKIYNKGYAESFGLYLATSTAITSVNSWTLNSETKFRQVVEKLDRNFVRSESRELCKLIGYCEEQNPFTRMMVFEYASNGTLFEHLHSIESCDKDIQGSQDHSGRIDEERNGESMLWPEVAGKGRYFELDPDTSSATMLLAEHI
ncbi:inactive receptor-like serine/threonine-protein kinase, partial [Tanacetum coccineum]